MLHGLKILGEVILGVAAAAGVLGLLAVLFILVMIYWDSMNGKNPFQ